MVNQKSSSWRDVVDGGDQDNLCSEHNIFVIQQRSIYLACALQKFVNQVNDNSRWTWKKCLEYSIALMNDIGIEFYTHWRRLAKWHIYWL